MKVIITENRLEQVAINWLNKNYGDLEQFETDKHPDYLFYGKGDKIIFDYNKENGKSFVHYDTIWLFLEDIFSFNYKQIQQVTKEWLREHYKLGVKTTLTKNLRKWYLLGKN